MAFFLFLYTVMLGWILVWYFVIGVIRDLCIMAGSLIIKKRSGKVAMSIMAGKVSVNIMALYWISVFFFREATTLHNWLMYLSVAFIIYSLINDIILFIVVECTSELHSRCQLVYRLLLDKINEDSV